MTLKSLFDNYIEFGKLIENKHGNMINLKNFDFNPTTMLPLFAFEYIAVPPEVVT